jgi:hypothetical protein
MSESERRRMSVAVRVRMTPEDEAAIREKAEVAGVTMSAFLRAAALGRKTPSRIDLQIVNELRRLGGLQKHLFTQSGGQGVAEHGALLDEIRDAIRRVGR